MQMRDLRRKFYWCCALTLLSGTVFAQTISTISSFDTDDEGWTCQHIGTAPLPTVTYNAAGGNPGGYISTMPPTSGGTVNISMTWYWVAPAKFLGSHDFAYNQKLKFDLQQSAAGTDNTQSDIIIAAGSNSIHLRLATKPDVSPAWSSYSIALDETENWRIGSVGGNKALKFQIKAVLANITAI